MSHNVQKLYMYAGAIRQLLYGWAHVREIIHSLKLVDNLPLHTLKSYNNLHITIIPETGVQTKKIYKVQIDLQK